MRTYILLLSVVLAISCKKDFLDNQNTNSVILREKYVKDLATTSDYLNGVYANAAIGIFLGYNVIYPDLAADNLKPVSASAGETPMLAHYNWQQEANELSNAPIATFNCNSISYACYQQIKNSNFIIESAEKYRNENAQLADFIKGQALALRAFANFMLLNVFSQPYNYTSDGSHLGIVLISGWNWIDMHEGRSSVAVCYDKIISDLQEAIALLQLAPIDKFRFNKISTRAFLARVYLFKGDYLSAKSNAVAVLGSTSLMDVGYPEKLFTNEDEETLLKLTPSTDGSGYSTAFSSYFFRSYILFNPTMDIVDMLTKEPTDRRSKWVEKSNDGYIVTKFPIDAVQGVSIPALSYYQPVIRTSELYLIAAESYAELNVSDSAIYYLDKIRMRANDNAQPTTATGGELRSLIQDERRKELCFEGFRLFDLLRHKRSIVRKDYLVGSPSTLSYPNNNAIAPIPTIDVKVDNINQNAGY